MRFIRCLVVSLSPSIQPICAIWDWLFKEGLTGGGQVLITLMVWRGVGLINPKCAGFIGSGLVINIPAMFEELDALEAQGQCSLPLILHLSQYTHTPPHINPRAHKC